MNSEKFNEIEIKKKIKNRMAQLQKWYEKEKVLDKPRIVMVVNYAFDNGDSKSYKTFCAYLKEMLKDPTSEISFEKNKNISAIMIMNVTINGSSGGRIFYIDNEHSNRKIKKDCFEKGFHNESLMSNP